MARLWAMVLTGRAMLRGGFVWWYRREVRARLHASLRAAAIELLLLCSVYVAVRLSDDALPARLAASACLWLVTGCNLHALFWKSLPEAVRGYRALRGWQGFVLRRILRVSLFAEMLAANIIMLSLCLGLTMVARLKLGIAFQFLAPWLELF